GSPRRADEATEEIPRAMGSRLRILSANLLNGGADPEALCDLIRSLNVDVAATQELAPEQAEALSEVLPFGILHPDRQHNGMGLALRWPARHDRVPLPRRDALVARLHPETWTGLSSSVEVVNIHVTAPQLPPPWQAFSQRRGQLRGLLEYLDGSPGGRCALVGDFNATPLWPLYRGLSRRLPDAACIDARRRGTRPRPTWGPTPGGPRLLRIDHAFLGNLEVEAFRVVRIPGSDHSAVVVDLET
ncbi:MAG: endonuclease/exonuclease/phosphatase family protein, partial [Myxococcota bacterium]